MEIKIALAGNPNCGKTTLFNALTGSNQFVGNWPGVTVEKKEGKLKKHKDVTIMDLPGIYSLSPYTLEEVVARNYLVGERPDAILNIIDGTNLERNLYLTTQLTELGIPVVVAINMIDLVKKNGDSINIDELSRQLGCKVVEISALKGTGIMEAAEAAIKAAGSTKTIPMHSFNGVVEHAIAHIEEAAVHNMPEEQQRWYAIKIFERDDKVLAKLDIPQNVIDHIEKDIQAAEKELDDDAESIITNERYIYIASIIKSCYKKKNKGKLTTSDKIDKVVTNRWLGLPIFAVIMFLVYYISMQTVGTAATDWANDGLFGDGWHLFGIGSSQAAEAEETYGDSDAIIEAFNAQYGNDDIAEAVDLESENYSEDAAKAALAEAGYPNGEGFPTVEYLYNTADNHKKIGEALQNMWQTELGVTVNLNNQDWNVFLQNRKDGNFQIARNGWIADYNDPCSFLDMWYTDGGNNDAQYSNPDYDAAIDAAKATSDPEERMKAFHEAEDILIGQDSVLAPIYFYTQPYMLNPDIDGMYYTPLGYFFFGYTSKK